jgi:hypothetical protein
MSSRNSILYYFLLSLKSESHKVESQKTFDIRSRTVPDMLLRRYGAGALLLTGQAFDIRRPPHLLVLLNEINGNAAYSNDGADEFL